MSVKTAIEQLDGDEDKNRRTTHIPSMPLLVRARAPVKPPLVLVTGMFYLKSARHTINRYLFLLMLCRLCFEHFSSILMPSEISLAQCIGLMFVIASMAFSSDYAYYISLCNAIEVVIGNGTIQPVIIHKRLQPLESSQLRWPSG